MKARLFSLLVMLSLGGLLVGCGAGASNSSASSGGSAQSQGSSGSGPGSDSAKQAVAGGVADAAVPHAVPGTNAGVSDAAAASAVARLIRTAQVTVEVADLSAAADRVRATATGLGGLVSAERTAFPGGADSSPRTGTGTRTSDLGVHSQSVITLRVPQAKLDVALTQVAAVGHELDRSSTSTDVTTTIADLNSRVSSQTASVERIRDLMSRATSLKDVVLIESELSQREADLESLEAQQRVLDDQADLATLTVTLRTPDAVAAAAPARETGFLPGLRGGWHALVASTVVVLTVLGALLPIAIALAVLTGLGYLGYRRFAARRVPVTASTPAPTTPAS